MSTMKGITNIYAKGDVIGVDVKGSNNMISKNTNISLESAEVNQIRINPNILSKLDQEYADVFKQVSESLNNEIKRSRSITPEQVLEIQKSLESLARETEGLKFGEQPSEKKKINWKQKFLIFGKQTVKVLPKTAAGLALLSPLTAGFAGVIESGLQSIVVGLQAAQNRDSGA